MTPYLWSSFYDDKLLLSQEIESIERCQKYRKKDFVAVTDFMMNLRMGKKIHLCEYETDELAQMH